MQNEKPGCDSPALLFEQRKYKDFNNEFFNNHSGTVRQCG